jgi:HEAT repeat protein
MSMSCRPLAAVCVLAFAGTLAAQSAKTSPDSSKTSSESSTRPPSITEVGGRSYGQWMNDLRSPDASKRADALLNLPFFGEVAADAVPAVLGHLQDPDVGVRTKAVNFFKVAHVRDKDKAKVVEALAQRLVGGPSVPVDTQAIVRYEAVTVLMRFPEDGKPAIPALLEGLKEKSCWETRHACVLVLRRAGWDPKTGPEPRVTRALLNQLTADRVERVKLEITISLGAMGRPSDPKLLAEVVDTLQRQGKTPDKPLKLWSHVSLMLLDDKIAEKSLTEIRTLLHSPERETRLLCLMALAMLGSRARAAVPDVLEMLDDKEKEVVGAAISALPNMDDRGPRVLNALIKITKGSEQPLIVLSCVALGEIGVAQPEVMEALTAVTQRKELEAQLRQGVEKIIEHLKKPPKK